ncbi:MAG: dockerin type I repeat-containing protein [Clostridia bacterium]|nr:dockerin type I repeat-containing protein [Clostridia bacterium]
MKKRLSLPLSLIAAVLSALLFVVAASANAIGDVDNDKKVTASDARLALRAAVILEYFLAGSNEFLACDVNFDKSITAADARLILRAAVKLETLKEKDADKPTECQHTWGSWTADKNAKKVVTGFHARTCTKCGKEEREECTYGAKNYITSAKTPTCKDKVQYYVVCSKCAGKKVTQIDAYNHSNRYIVSSRSKEATCTEAGYNVYQCRLCKMYGDEATGKDREILYETVPAPGHTVEPGAVSAENDIICARCGKTLTPSFNTLVNSLKTSDLCFSSLTKSESYGTLKKYDMDVPLLIRMEMSKEGVSIDDMKEEFAENFTQRDVTYSDYLINQKIKTSRAFPVQGQNYVSALKSSDISSIHVIEDLTSVDFISEIPDTAKVVSTGSYTYSAPLSQFKGLVTADSSITKITVTIKTEKYSDVKRTSSETALMRITGIDIRTQNIDSQFDDLKLDALNSPELGDMVEFNMNCNEITSNCVVSYYFVVDKDNGGDKVYTPIAAKYFTTLEFDQHFDFNAMEMMKANIDFSFNNDVTNYLIFTADK